MTPKLCAATNDTREEASSNINYFFCERTRLGFAAFVPCSGASTSSLFVTILLER